MTSQNPVFTEGARFERARDTSWSKLGDEALVLDLTRRRSHRLVGVALEIWEALLDGKSLGEISEAICADYEVAAEVAARDCLATVTTLVNEGILELRKA